MKKGVDKESSLEGRHSNTFNDGLLREIANKAGYKTGFDLEDSLQITYLKFYELVRSGKLGDVDNLAGYLYRSVVNEILSSKDLVRIPSDKKHLSKGTREKKKLARQVSSYEEIEDKDIVYSVLGVGDSPLSPEMALYIRDVIESLGEDSLILKIVSGFYPDWSGTKRTKHIIREVKRLEEETGHFLDGELIRTLCRRKKDNINNFVENIDEIKIDIDMVYDALVGNV